MRSFASYISKHLASFVAFILILLFVNTVVYSLTFQKIMTEDYRNSSPQSMLEMTADAATPEQLSDNMIQKLRQNHIWAIYLNGILRIILFLSGTPMMGCWYWGIRKTAIQNSPAITIPLQHFDVSLSLCLECWD